MKKKVFVGIAAMLGMTAAFIVNHKRKKKMI